MISSPPASLRHLIRDLQTSKSKGTVKFQPEKRTARLSGLVYCTGIQGMQPACAFVVDYSAATLWFYISQKHMGMCTCANQQEIAVPNMPLGCTSCADFSRYSIFQGKEESIQTLFCCIGWKWNSKQATPTRNRQTHPFSSLAKNRHLPLTIDRPPVNGPVKFCSSDTAKLLGKSGPDQNSASQTDSSFGGVLIWSKNIHGFIAWADCQKGVGRNIGKKQ